MKEEYRIIQWVWGAGILIAGISLILVFIGVWGPIQPEVDGFNKASVYSPPICAASSNTNSLQKIFRHRILIKPLQVKAAVKDNKVAEQLVGKIKLHGIVQVQGRQMAYLHVDKQSTQAVQEGEQILDFIVKTIEPGRVTLTLDGIEVAITH